MRNTRSSKSSTTPLKENSKSSEATKSVFIIKENLLHSSNDDNITIIKMQRLRHPGSEESAYFVVPKQNSNSNQQVFEIIEFNQAHRSWFINESYTSNGRLYITVPMDSLFFALYYLRKYCQNQAKPLDQLEDQEYPLTIELILNCLTSERLLKIADEKGAENFKAYKYNHDKTLKWLSLKTKYLSYILKSQNINAGVSATSANYTKGGEISSDFNENDYLQLASEIISTYITADLYDELKNLLGICNKSNANKRKSLPMNSENKRIKIDNVIDDTNSPVEEIKSLTSSQQQQKEKKQTTKDKSLAKAASGTKNISSFFQKKSK